MPRTRRRGCARYGVKQTSDPAFVADWAKRERKECLFEIPVAVEKHSLVLQKRCFTGEGARKRLPDNGPGRSPALGEVLSHGDRMLVTADGPIAVVIDLHMLGSPCQRDRKVGGEAEADGGAQALRP